MSSSGRRCSVSDWVYVAIAFTAVWGSLAVYTFLLARRVSQAREVARALREALETSAESPEQDDIVCDGQPAP